MAKKVGQLHTEVFNAYQELLQGGEAQLLMKMKSFWEYLLPDGDRKARKTIHKTSKTGKLSVSSKQSARNILNNRFQYLSL